MLKEKIGPELFVAIVGSILILAIMGALSYLSKDNTFLYIGLMTAVVSIPAAFYGNKL